MAQSFLRNLVLPPTDDEEDETKTTLNENEKRGRHLDIADSLIKADKTNEQAEDDDDFYIPRKYSKYT